MFIFPIIFPIIRILTLMTVFTQEPPEYLIEQGDLEGVVYIRDSRLNKSFLRSTLRNISEVKLQNYKLKSNQSNLIFRIIRISYHPTIGVN